MSTTRTTTFLALLLCVCTAASAQPPAVNSFGTGCADSNGRITILTSSQLPFLGNGSFELNVTMVSPGTQTFVFLSLAQSPAPLQLGSGCDVLIDVPSAVQFIVGGLSPLGPAAAGPMGFSVHPLPVPNAPALAGFQLYCQAAALDPALALGFTVSNGVELVLN